MRIGDGKHIETSGYGDINILAFDGKNWNQKHLSDVLYVPNLNFNLFSLGASMDKGLTQQSDNKICKLLKDGNIVAVGERNQDKLFEMKFQVVIQDHQALVTAKDTLVDWHKNSHIRTLNW